MVGRSDGLGAGEYDQLDFVNFLSQIPADLGPAPGGVPQAHLNGYAASPHSLNIDIKGDVPDNSTWMPIFPASLGSTRFNSSPAQSVSPPQNDDALQFDSSRQGSAGIDSHNRAAECNAAEWKSRNKAKNREAQRRFRMKQKNRMATTEEAVEALTAQMQSLQTKAEALEARNRVLQHIVDTSSTHIRELVTEQEVDVKQQEIILRDSRAAYGRALCKEEMDVGSITIEQHMNDLFPRYLERLRELLSTSSPESEAELTNIVLLRRKEENRLGLFSHWPTAAKVWNLECTPQFGSPPQRQFWADVLMRSQLDASQRSALAAARVSLLQRMASIREQRQNTFAAVSVALLQQSQLGDSPALRDMRASLEEERLATLDFLHSAIDHILTPKQEALLDSLSYPWWPDLWTMADIAASLGRPAAAPNTNSLADEPVAGLPQLSTFELLHTPLLALGAGLQLKRSLALRELPRHILAAAAWLPPSISTLQHMSILDIMCGKYLPGSAESNGVRSSPPSA
ncbi:hypothetical protein WJX73_001497 [Symbiochloris irregularis]|uniref:BZIP domain-containing protein n=1 Tax=Symbiochloris irregularis TaxID=706552 RepID=A0AAW1NZP1_9CHLO